MRQLANSISGFRFSGAEDRDAERDFRAWYPLAVATVSYVLERRASWELDHAVMASRRREDSIDMGRETDFF